MLEKGLTAQLLERRGWQARNPRGRVGSGKGRERLDPDAGQLDDLVAADPGDADEMVVLLPKQVVGPRVPRELRIRRLVSAAGLPDEEVGDSPPRAVDEDALVHGVHAGAQRRLGGAGSLLEAAVERDLHDLAAFGAKPSEAHRLVLLPLRAISSRCGLSR